jgi:hypothetical protein
MTIFGNIMSAIFGSASAGGRRPHHRHRPARRRLKSMSKPL